ncbi:MAG: ABC transporter permease [Anaerolineaceae bacterium]
MEKPSIYIYDSARHPFRPLEEFQQVFKYRFLISQLLRRDIVTRYKRSVLGIAWTMLNPLGTMIVLSIAFSQVFKMTEGYPAYVLSGLMAWNFFSQASNASMVNLVWGEGLLKRIYMPKTSFALSAIGTGIVNVLLSLIPMIIVMVAIKVPIKLSILFLPIPIIVLAIFTLGFGLIISTFAVYFPDVAEMYQIVLTAWLYLTPIIYPEDILPSGIKLIISTLNPLYSLVKLFRIPIYYGRMPTFVEWAVPVSFALVFFIVGWMFFVYRSNDFSQKI